MTFRAITLPEGAAPGLGGAPTAALDWIAIRELVIDDSYQRPLAEKNWQAIRKIAARFTWGHFSLCIVARLDDAHYAVIDGQHRAHAALLAGYSEVPCLIVDLPDAADQARAFAAINGDVTAMTIWHLFRAALAAGEHWALRGVEVVEACGCRLMTSNKSITERKARELYNIGMVRALIRDGQEEALARVLRALAAAPCGQAPHLWTDRVLRPLVDLAIKRGEVDGAAWAAFLAQQDLAKLDRGVDRLREEPRYSRQSRRAVMSLVLEAALDRWLGVT